MTDDPLLPPDDGDDDTPEVDADEVSSRPAVLRMNIVCPHCHADMYLQYVDPSSTPGDGERIETHMRLLVRLHECPGPGWYPEATKYPSGLPWVD